MLSTLFLAAAEDGADAGPKRTEADAQRESDGLTGICAVLGGCEKEVGVHGRGPP